METDKSDKKTDTYTDRLLNTRRQGINDLFSDIGHSKENKYQTFQEHCGQRKLPGMPHRKTNGIGKEGIDTHTRCKSEGHLGIERHDKRRNAGGNRRGSKKRSFIHSRNAKNGWVYSQNIGHCEESGDACDDFSSDRRRCRIKSEVFWEKLVHFNKRCLKSRKIKQNLRIKTVVLKVFGERSGL